MRYAPAFSNLANHLCNFSDLAQRQNFPPVNERIGNILTSSAVSRIVVRGYQSHHKACKDMVVELTQYARDVWSDDGYTGVNFPLEDALKVVMVQDLSFRQASSLESACGMSLMCKQRLMVLQCFQSALMARMDRNASEKDMIYGTSVVDHTGSTYMLLKCEKFAIVAKITL